MLKLVNRSLVDMSYNMNTNRYTCSTIINRGISRILTADPTRGCREGRNIQFSKFSKKMHEIKKLSSVGHAPLNPPTINSTKVGPQNPEPTAPPPPPAINGYVNLEQNSVVAQQQILGLQQ